MRGGCGSWVMSAISLICASAAFKEGSRLSGILCIFAAVCFLAHIFVEVEKVRKYAVVAALISLIAGVFVSADDNPVVENSTQSDGSNYVQSEKEQNTTVFSVGDTVNAGNCRIQLTQAVRVNPDTVSHSVKKGNMLIALYFVVQNTSNSEIWASADNFKCYADNRVVDNLTLLFGDIDFFQSEYDLSPGRQTEGYMLYEIPENCQSMEIEYETDLYSKKKVLFKVF